MLKKRLIFLILLLFIFTPSRVYAQEVIKNFSSSITIFKDAKVSVEETVVYDFGESKRRGIIRNIPVVYKNDQGKKFRIDLDVLNITDELEKPYKYKVSEKDDQKIIQIGEENKYITGPHTYVINYSVLGVITYFSDHDEFYWNVTGNAWNVPVEKSSVVVNFDFPKPTEIKSICYTGSFGSKLQNCQIIYPKTNTIIINSNISLSSGEGLTFAASFPKNLVAIVEPKEIVDFWETGSGKISIVIIAILIFLYYVLTPFIMFLLWFKFGRDPKVARPVRAWFDPPRDKFGNYLRPAEVGTIVDEHADNQDIVATIVDLAIRGFFKIREVKKGKEYWFEKKKDYKSEKLLDYEKRILEHFFEKKETITTSELKKDFYKTSSSIKNSLYTIMVAKEFFPKNPKKIRDKYYILSALSLFTLNIPLSIAALLFGRAMPRKTIFGAVSQNIALGLKNFLTSQERQLKFQANDLYLFEKLLPFAIVFNVEKIWAKRFEDITSQPPNWYEGSFTGNFNSSVFVYNLSSLTSSFCALAATPGSTSSSGFSSGFSGGGSSGGGFGGGGGSSW